MPRLTTALAAFAASCAVAALPLVATTAAQADPLPSLAVTTGGPITIPDRGACHGSFDLAFEATPGQTGMATLGVVPRGTWGTPGCEQAFDVYYGANRTTVRLDVVNGPAYVNVPVGLGMVEIGATPVGQPGGTQSTVWMSPA